MKGTTCCPVSCAFHGPVLTLSQAARLALMENSSMRCPPMAVSAMPMGVVTPRSARPCAKYQQVAPMAKRGQLPASTQPAGAACAAVIHGLLPLTPP